MKLIKIIRTTIILYATGYAAICAIAVMKGNHLRVFSHEVHPFTLSIFSWVAIGCMAILFFEKTVKTLSKTVQRLFYLGIFALIVFALMKLFV
ncbi:hypothetical protein [Parabacteroides sp. FAFU027]|uniref:hypothetical protein n=1 Tax=Parabacteroides sp. FAFU027 TaxID=2922715 RepID=UPI001FAEE080|nr:hypothetical protein [Parabacteroides sp. FAFU027]